MRNLMLIFAALCAMAFVAPGGPADAQTIHWVGPGGSDINPCTQTSPCATFAYARIGANEINCLGSGNYGALNGTNSITSSIVIDCGAGNTGEMTLNGGTDAVININTSSAATIVLRHLTLNGGDTSGPAGINTENFADGTLIVEDCVIFGFHYSVSGVGAGIYFAPQSGRGMLQVTNSLIYDSAAPIWVSPGSGQIASVALEGDRLLDGNVGFYMAGSGVIAGTIAHTLIADNSEYAIFSGASSTYLTIEESRIIDNPSYGLFTNSGGSNLLVGASTIAGNGTGVHAAAGNLVSFGNNQLYDNASNGAFTSTVGLK